MLFSNKFWMFAHSGDSNFLNDTGSIFANLNLNSTRFWLLFHLHSPLLFSPYFAISCCRKLAIGNVYLVALTFDIAQFSSRQMSGLCNAQITSTQAESAGEECRNNSLFVWGSSEYGLQVVFHIRHCRVM